MNGIRSFFNSGPFSGSSCVGNRENFRFIMHWIILRWIISEEAFGNILSD